MPRPKKYESQTDYKRKFNEVSYDRLAITIPKGQKAAVEAAAVRKGISVNALVNALLMAETGQTEIEWKQQDKKEEG